MIVGKFFCDDYDAVVGWNRMRKCKDMSLLDANGCSEVRVGSFGNCQRFALISHLHISSTTEFKCNVMNDEYSLNWVCPPVCRISILVHTLFDGVCVNVFQNCGLFVVCDIFECPSMHYHLCTFECEAGLLKNNEWEYFHLSPCPCPYLYRVYRISYLFVKDSKTISCSHPFI